MSKLILILAANPKSTQPLRLAEEVREIENGLERAKNRDNFLLKQKWAARPEDVRRAMLDCKPNIVHFSGHGSGKDGIAFEDENGKEILVGADTLADFFKNFSDHVQCVVLNACYSEMQAKAIAGCIPYVIGMKNAIGDEAAIKFSVAFYDTLGAGKSFESAYKIACNAMQWFGMPDHLVPSLIKKNKSDTTISDQKTETLSSFSTKGVSTQKESQEEDFEYDAYISYVDMEPDASWVWDILLPRLEEAGLRIVVSGDTERPGVARIVEIERGMREAKRTILLLSNNYLSDTMADFENALGQTMGIQEGSYRLLPIKTEFFDSSSLPTRLSMLTILNMSHPRRAEREFQRLIQALQSPLPKMR